MRYNPIWLKRRQTLLEMPSDAAERQRIVAAMIEEGRAAYRGSIESVAGPMLDAAIEEMERPGG